MPAAAAAAAPGAAARATTRPAAATARRRCAGTTWLVVDRCDASTLFKVAEGTVWVQDFVKDKQVVLDAGEQYIAKAPIPRLNPKQFP